jgi:uncharacterized coiled-coil protein SlyX
MSDWRVIPTPLLMPHKCVMCPRAAGTHQGRWIDPGPTGENIVTGERAYLCDKCVELGARLLGFVDEEGSEERLGWQERIAGLEAHVVARDKVIDEQNGMLTDDVERMRGLTERAETAEAHASQLQATLDRIRSDAMATTAAVRGPTEPLDAVGVGADSEQGKVGR